MASMTLAQFALHLAGFQHALHQHCTTAFAKVAEIVQAEAKHEIGHYQTGAGPFATWPELADSTKDDRVRKGFTENDPGLRTGGMRDSIEKASDHECAVVYSDDPKLEAFELGTVTQPPRSVLGLAVIHTEKQIEHELGTAVVKALVGHNVAGGSLPIP